MTVMLVVLLGATYLLLVGLLALGQYDLRRDLTSLRTEMRAELDGVHHGLPESQADVGAARVDRHLHPPPAAAPPGPVARLTARPGPKLEGRTPGTGLS